MANSARIDDRVWRRIRRRVLKAANDKQHVKVGVLSELKGGETTDEGVSMVEIATIHEFGSPAAGIRERSFIRAPFHQTRALVVVTVPLAKKVATGKMTMEKALSILGVWGATHVKNFITQGESIPPPLAEATKEKKGSTRALVDTGRLVQSIQWQLAKGGG